VGKQHEATDNYSKQKKKHKKLRTWKQNQQQNDPKKCGAQVFAWPSLYFWRVETMSSKREGDQFYCL
jgi:hypothetical protein